MKKLVILAIASLVMLIGDGFLSHDIFDFKFDSVSKWLFLATTLFVYAVIAWAESSKKRDNRNNQR